MTMGEYIKKLRTENGWSQEELGRKVGVNRAAVNKWEQGTVENIKRSTIKKLSEVFRVSPQDLMCWDREEPKDGQQQIKSCEFFEKCYGRAAFEAVSMFLELDTIDQAKIVERMKTLLEADKYFQKGSKSA